MCFQGVLVVVVVAADVCVFCFCVELCGKVGLCGEVGLRYLRCVCVWLLNE